MTNPTTNRMHQISRRTFLAASLASLALPARHMFASTVPTLAHTSNGTLRGESANGVRVFRGIPFAQPPIGPLRFLPPLAAKPWKGERDASSFAAAPMQWADARTPGEGPVVTSEDCLYLNVWAPDGKGPFPVFVWIHGGGFIAGHAFERMYDGSEFARQGIVCITVPYRLGVFGFLDLGPLFGPEYSGSANNALCDLIASLRWVQQNVASFGGDPDRVTIGGESAGAKLTDILMGVPSAQPLFHQMISESGGAERLWSKENSAAVSKGYGEVWKRQPGQGIPALKTADAGLLINAQHAFFEDWPQHFPLRSEIDGKLLPQLPVKTIASGSTQGKRLLIGTNRDESALFIGPRPKADPAPKDLGNLPLEIFNQVFHRYKEIYPEMTDSQRRISALTAEEYWIPSIRVADAHLTGGGTTFMYLLDFTESSGRLSGFAYHSLDVPLVWDHPHLDAANAQAEASLAKQVHLAWVAFIKGETPSAPGLPAWPKYNLATSPTMILDTQSSVEERPQEAELRLWGGVL
jgi:para-nitrobenzyl esterase